MARFPVRCWESRFFSNLYGMTLPDLESDAEMGPAMLTLNERQRKFVCAVIELGRVGIVNNAKAAELAGYSANSRGALRVRAHELAHDTRIQAAMLEESQRTLSLAASAVATPVVIEIAMSKKFDPRDRLRACEMLFNRGGLPAQTEHKVTVEHHSNPKMVELATRLAHELGVNPERLLGMNRAAAAGLRSAPALRRRPWRT